MIISIELHVDDWERVVEFLSTAADAAAVATEDIEDDEDMEEGLAVEAMQATRLYHYISTQVGISVTKSNDLRFKGPSRN